MRSRRSVIVVFAIILALAWTGTGSAMAAHREFGDHAAKVKIVKTAFLRADGTVRASARVWCRKAWEPAELSLLVSQGATGPDSAEGYTVPSFACDRNWHKVTFNLDTINGHLTPGPIHINAQYLVTHIEFGDSAGGHAQGDGLLRRADYPTG